MVFIEKAVLFLINELTPTEFMILVLVLHMIAIVVLRRVLYEEG